MIGYDRGNIKGCIILTKDNRTESKGLEQAKEYCALYQLVLDRHNAGIQKVNEQTLRTAQEAVKQYQEMAKTATL